MPVFPYAAALSPVLCLCHDALSVVLSFLFTQKGVSLSPLCEFRLLVIYALVVIHALAQVVYTMFVSHALNTVDGVIYGMLIACAMRIWPLIYVTHTDSERYVCLHSVSVSVSVSVSLSLSLSPTLSIYSCLESAGIANIAQGLDHASLHSHNHTLPHTPYHLYLLL